MCLHRTVATISSTPPPFFFVHIVNTVAVLDLQCGQLSAVFVLRTAVANGSIWMSNMLVGREIRSKALVACSRPGSKFITCRLCIASSVMALYVSSVSEQVSCCVSHRAPTVRMVFVVTLELRESYVMMQVTCGRQRFLRVIQPPSNASRAPTSPEAREQVKWFMCVCFYC